MDILRGEDKVVLCGLEVGWHINGGTVGMQPVWRWAESRYKERDNQNWWIYKCQDGNLELLKFPKIHEGDPNEIF